MSVSLKKFAQKQLEGSGEWLEVSHLADRLFEHLNSPEASARISEANQPGRSSNAVQATFGDFARELGFENEKVGLFANEELALRPDYFRRVGTSGVLLEVERGKTTINNMDLLDFWKCHVCAHARYLFLLVPVALRQNPTMSPRNEFAMVTRRLAKFFEPHTYTNVRGLCVFGY
jgi:hypothetical protein